MTDVASFKTRFPEYTATDPARIQMFLDDAALFMTPATRWLSYYDVAHAYYAAHLLAVGEHTEGGDTGILAPVKSQEVDDVSLDIAINNVEPTFDELSSTAYGKRVLFYRKICFSGIIGV